MKSTREAKLILILGLLAMSFLETVLRPGPDSFLSAYRVFIPLILFFIVLPKIRHYQWEVFFLVVVFVWNLVWIRAFNHDMAVMIQFYIHIICCFSVYSLVKYLKVAYPDRFDSLMFRLLDLMTLLTIGLFLLQYPLRFNLPNTVPGRVNTFYWTENEMGMSLVLMSTLYLQRFLKGKGVLDLAKVLIISLILYLNDNRISILGFGLFFLLLLFLEYSGPKSKKQALIAVAVLVLLVFLINPVFNFKGSQTGIREMILDPIRRIITLDPYRLAGSLYDRTDAIIYGLMELKKTYYLGIGLGNSINVLALPQYKLASAKSMHNIVAQLWVELGILAMILYAVIATVLIRDLRRRPQDLTVNYRFAFVLAFILISMQSSTGIFSNYFVIAFISYVSLSKDLLKKVSRRQLLPRIPKTYLEDLAKVKSKELKSNG